MSDLISVAGNNLDRDIDPDYEVYLAPDSSMYDRWQSISANKVRNNQGDITSPVITSMDTIPGTVNQAFEYTLMVDENSFAVSSTSVGMAVSVT